ncbi:cuticlin-1 [Tribolium madens]|uniref:cuticlin-1 n=1 Tax=Tribolium madens TaxID=41895 RepID=UPI001CF74169|nr:cuticlin-1 [Tribolium madens]
MCRSNLFSKLFIIVFIAHSYSSEENNGIFQSDIGDQMTIGLSDTGYKSVKLKCGSNSMLVALETDEDFDGVIYTRGNFHDKTSACFLDPGPKRGQRSFSIKFPLDQCNTQKKGETYSNTLVLQHDKELIMPGDAAFHLECDYSKPRDVTVNANLHNEKSVTSRITLTDADPSFKKNKRDKRSSVENKTDSVVLTQEFLKGRMSANI